MSESSDKTPAENPPGHVVFDERGTAVWQPNTPIQGPQALDELLHTEELTIIEYFADGTRGRTRGERGFDPYRSGVVMRSEPRCKHTNLRTLSDAIKAARRAKL
jgi:hypothetical protein